MANSKGLKQYQKVQKEKIKAKRVAAAGKTKQRKVLIPAEVKSTTGEDVKVSGVPSKSGTTDITFAVIGEYLNTNSDMKETSMTNFDITDGPASLPDEPFDVIAYRKELEVALYDNMESPKQRFARLNRLKTINSTTELVIDLFDDDTTCTDIAKDDSTIEAPSTAHRRADDHAGDRFIPIHDLVSSVEAQGMSSIGMANLHVSYTLDEIESQLNTSHTLTNTKDRTVATQQYFAISELFLAAANENTSIVRLPKSNSNNAVSSSRTQDSLKNNIVRANDKDKDTSITFNDPAIISCKIEEDALITDEFPSGYVKDAHDAALNCISEQSTKQLKALLGITTTEDTTNLSLQACSEKLKALLGIGESRTPSPSSSEHTRTSTLSPTAKVFTPLTDYSPPLSPADNDYCTNPAVVDDGPAQSFAEQCMGDIYNDFNYGYEPVADFTQCQHPSPCDDGAFFSHPHHFFEPMASSYAPQADTAMQNWQSHGYAAY